MTDFASSSAPPVMGQIFVTVTPAIMVHGTYNLCRTLRSARIMIYAAILFPADVAGSRVIMTDGDGQYSRL